MIGCLETLGKLQRAVVTLRMLDEVAGEDVAATLELPPSHVLWQHDQLVQRAEDHHQANLFCVLFRS